MSTTEFNKLYNHTYSEERRYVAPKDPNVTEALERFRDRKFGIMFHWGLYSQLGIIESWMLPDKDRKWAWKENKSFDHMTCNEFKDMYWNLKKTFNPVNFDPQKWAKTAKDAGFKYVLFTTKHHDGFCMWDTKYTDFKVTALDCPFSKNEHADIVKSIFNSFRDEGLKVHAYFSKPDWHSDCYWAKGFKKNEYMTRNTSYNTYLHPKIWKKYCEYTKNQMLELISNYGRIECLWLDGGQVRPSKGMNIHLSKIMKEARKIQPWLMVADRTVGGKNENFITPEQTVPEHEIKVPWESCLTLGTAFSYRFKDKFKDAKIIIHTLCDIVAKGGNLALNIAPSPDGTWPDEVYAVLTDIGVWLKKNGFAIYETRAAAPYREGNVAYTKKGNETYAIYMPQNKDNTLPDEISIIYEHKAKEVLLNGKKSEFSQKDFSLSVKIDGAYENEPAYVFTIR